MGTMTRTKTTKKPIINMRPILLSFLFFRLWRRLPACSSEKQAGSPRHKQLLKTNGPSRQLDAVGALTALTHDNK